MKDVYYLIIGGGVAGTAAAENIRRIDEKGTIAIVSDEPYPLYSRIALSKPNFFLQKLPSSAIWLKKPEWYSANKITFMHGRAASLNIKNKIVHLGGGDEIRYHKMLIAIGGKPRVWQVAGTNLRGVFNMHTLDDAERIMEHLNQTWRAVVIGGGFIAFEMCAMLRQRGIEVLLIIGRNYFWDALLDDNTAGMVEEAMLAGGVKIIKNNEVASINGTDEVSSIKLKSGEEIPCEMVITGIGIEPDTAWLAKAGLKINRGVLTNEYLEASEHKIWVAGDAAEYFDIFSKKYAICRNWANAQIQGGIAGRNMAGQKMMFHGNSFYTAQGFGISLAFAGDVLADAKREIIIRNSREPFFQIAFIAKDAKLVGAVTVNCAQEMKVISALIQQQLNISEIKSELQNPDFRLEKLIKY